MAACQTPPSIWTSTLLTAALSDAFPDTVTEPLTVAPDDGVAIVTVGAVLSAFCTVTGMLAVEELPAASHARA